MRRNAVVVVVMAASCAAAALAQAPTSAGSSPVALDCSVFAKAVVACQAEAWQALPAWKADSEEALGALVEELQGGGGTSDDAVEQCLARSPVAPAMAPSGPLATDEGWIDAHARCREATVAALAELAATTSSQAARVAALVQVMGAYDGEDPPPSYRTLARDLARRMLGGGEDPVTRAVVMRTMGSCACNEPELMDLVVGQMGDPAEVVAASAQRRVYVDTGCPLMETWSAGGGPTPEQVGAAQGWWRAHRAEFQARLDSAKSAPPAPAR